MSRALCRQQTAKYTLLLVSIVIFVCSGQRFGYLANCTSSGSSQGVEHQANHQPHLIALPGMEVTAADPIDSSQCSMSDHLLQMHQNSIENGIIHLFVVIFVALLLAAIYHLVPVFTEPIPSTRRRHLTLCVFRE